MFEKSILKSSYINRSLKYECHCGIDAPLMIAWTDAKPRRRFYGCEMYKMQGYQKRSHFVWLDEKMNPRVKEVLLSFLQNLNDEKQKVKDYIRKDEEIKMKMKLLKKHLKLNWMITIVVLIAYVISTMMKYDRSNMFRLCVITCLAYVGSVVFLFVTLLV
ncbi:hypothetical protein KIW84_010573 [Lathyrus oleraceus]|uniref:Zinc finger GRF-type domain-containing protein n=1 Tax=Pisum sativum TaxID=3888 RepID=A0A9D4YKC3_PEA|nr:hypothetical protein KIW84_010573 [Pisum sativum]